VFAWHSAWQRTVAETQSALKPLGPLIPVIVSAELPLLVILRVPVEVWPTTRSPNDRVSGLTEITRVSTTDQTCENQLLELRKYCQARGWAIQREYVDAGVSGSKDRRPALDAFVHDAKRRLVDVVVCWRLDRMGRNLKHLITLLEELQALGVAFVSLAEGIDATTPAGKLQMHILGAIAEFERARIQERVRAGLARARAQGVVLGRPRRRIDPERLAAVAGLPEREAARRLGIPRSTFQRFVAQRLIDIGN
jgi:DNA invertase Pin-like site-specific DNA recombinase